MSEDSTEREPAMGIANRSPDADAPSYRALYEFIPDAIFVADAGSGMIIDANPAAEALIGRPLSEIRTLHHSQLHPGEEAESARRTVANFLRTPASVRNQQHVGEWTVVRPDGQRIPVEISTSVWTGPDRKTLLIGVFRDASERRRVAEELRKSEERFRQIVESAGSFVWEVDSKGLYTFASAAVERILGYTPEEIVGRLHFYDLFTPDTREETRSAVFEAFGLDEPIRALVNWNVTKDGSVVALETTAFPFRDANGELLGYRGSDRDITERKRVEDALRASEERFRALADSALVGIYILQDGKYQYVNPAMARVFGYSVAEMTGMTPNDIVHPSHHTMVGENIRRRIAGEVPSLHYEVRGRYRDGSIRDVEVYGSTVQLNGRPALVGTLLDITHRKRAEAERERLLEQLAQAQKMECVGRLAGGIAHDFNNLMCAVMMYADSALDLMTAGASAEESITAIRDAAEKAVALGQQLMAFSSRQVLQTEVLDLNSVIADSKNLVQRLIGEDVTVVFKPGPESALLRSDRGQLTQIIVNLAVNSRDAMPEGGTFTMETDTVEVDDFEVQRNPEATVGQYVKLVVRDTGIGMDNETQARLFEPFFTTKAIGKGTGLGLSVVYGIVKQSGGFITVTSEPEHGTEFRICFPAAQELPKPILDIDEGPIQGGSETILLVEDEASLRHKLHEVLKDAGFQVLVAADGEQALQLSLHDTRVIHLLLTDVVMPQRSGPQLAARLLTLRPATKVLYMSGYPNADDVDLQSQSNFIQKPFSRNKLLRRVREVLDARFAAA